MKPNPDWPRWFYASFIDNFSTFSLPIYAQNQTRPTNIHNFLEIRMNGPHYNQVNQNLWCVDIFLAGLIEIYNDDSDLFKIQRLTGELFTKFNRDISAFRYGDGPNDDGSLICCFKLVPANNEKIRTLTYGQSEAATRITQCAIEAHYTTLLGFIYDGPD